MDLGADDRSRGDRDRVGAVRRARERREATSLARAARGVGDRIRGFGQLKAGRAAGLERRRERMNDRGRTEHVHCDTCARPARLIVDIRYWSFEYGTEEERQLNLCRR